MDGRIMAVRPARGLLLAVATLFAAGASAFVAYLALPEIQRSPDEASRLYVWASDADGVGVDFMAVYDVSVDSARNGRLLTTIPTGPGAPMAHHAEASVASNGMLLVNALHSRQNYLFDLRRPNRPTLRGTLPPAPGLDYPHGFARFGDGQVIVTYQRGDGTRPGDPGGIAHFDRRGRFLRASSAADRIAGDSPVRPNGIAVLPAIDRALTTSRSMFDERSADVVQLWRLSDLKLLTTLVLEPRVDSLERQPFEPRVLPDGRSVLISTYNCGIYLATGLDGSSPSLRFVHAAAQNGARGCAIPVLRRNRFVLPIAFAHTIVSYDVSNPAQPAEVHRFDTGPGFFPQWLAADPNGDRIVVTDQGNGDPLVAILRLDDASGRLVVDERFRGGDGEFIGVSLAREGWPHGDTGPAIPHAAVFGR